MIVLIICIAVCFSFIPLGIFRAWRGGWFNERHFRGD